MPSALARKTASAVVAADRPATTARALAAQPVLRSPVGRDDRGPARIGLSGQERVERGGVVGSGGSSAATRRASDVVDAPPTGCGASTR